MSDDRDLPLRGAGGGKGGAGGSGGLRESRNTLQSRAVAKIVDLLCEGPIVGLVAGASSIYLDDTPLPQHDPGSGFTYATRLGTPDQAYIPGFTDTSTPVGVGVEVRKTLVGGGNGAISRAITDADADAVDVVVTIPALSKLESDGELRGYSVAFSVTVTNTASGQSTTVPKAFSGKNTSAYQTSTRVSLPKGASPAGPWTLTVTRLSDDETLTKFQNKTVFTSYTIIKELKLSYMDSAVVALAVDAAKFQKIPTRGYDIYGLQVRVPVNYNPATRVYTGLWNGSFQTAWTDNPVWCMLDLLTSKRYGLGIPLARIDLGAFYEAAQYCDESVPDVYGGNEPRFRLNTVLSTAQDVYQVLQTLAANVRGLLYWSAGSVTLRLDKPADPVKLVTPANVVDGKFSYAGSALKARHSVAMVTWNDPADLWRPAVEVVEDAAALQEIGYNETSVSLVGCTSRGQANRHARWLLDTERTATETVTYRAGLDHAAVVPGDIVSVADPNYAAVRMGGRITAMASTSSVTLDQAPDTTGLGALTLGLTMPDGTIQTRNVAGIVGNVVTLASGFTTLADTAAVWVLTGANLAPRQFRVLAVKESGPQEFEVTGLLHDPTKYARIEQRVTLAAPAHVLIPGAAPPGAVRFTEGSYRDAQNIRRLRLTVGWDEPVPNGAADVPMRYRFKWRKDGGEWSAPVELPLREALIDFAEAGTFEVSIVAINTYGRESTPRTAAYTAVLGGSSALGAPTNLRVAGRTAGAGNQGQFDTADLFLVWDAPGTVNDSAATLLHYFVTIKNPDTGAVLFTTVHGIAAGAFQYSYAQNVKDGGPRRTLAVEVVAVDNWGRQGTVATLTATNPSPAVPGGVTVTGSFDIATLRFTSPADSDFAGVKVHVSTTSGFTPGDGNLVYDGPDTTVTFRTPAKNTTYYVKLAAYDLFGKAGITYSGEYSLTPQPIDHADLAASFEAELANYNAQYTLKLANGAIAGYGLASSGPASAPVSAFVVQADKFGIVKPGSGTATIAIVSRTSNVVTVTTAVGHGFASGSSVTVAGVADTAFNGLFVITGVPSATTFTYAQAAANASSTGGSATVAPLIPFVFDTTGPVPVLAIDGYLTADKIRSGTFQAVNQVGSSRVVIDGPNERLTVSDGTRDRVKLGKLSTNNYGIEIIDAAGNVVLSNDGRLGSTVYIGSGSQTLGSIAENAATPSINYVGEFPAAPTQVQLGTAWKINAVYKNTTDGNSYILFGSPLSWQLYLSAGAPGKSLSLILDSTVFSFSRTSRVTVLDVTKFGTSTVAGTGMSAVNAADYPNMDESGTKGPLALFASGISSSRTLRTATKVVLTDLYYLEFEVNLADGAAWGDAPDAGDDLYVSYSTDGLVWSSLGYVYVSSTTPNNWTKRTITIPAGAKGGAGVYLQIKQMGSLSGTADNWAITSIVGRVAISDINILASGANLTGSPTFSIVAGSAILTSSALGSNYRTLRYADLLSTYPTTSVTIGVLWDGLIDTATVTVTTEGSDVVSAYLTNEAHTVAADASGNVASFATAGGEFVIYAGSSRLTSPGANGATFSVVAGSVTDVSISIDTDGVYTISGLTAASGSATLRAEYQGVTIDRVYTVTKAIAGATGAAGKALTASSTQPYFYLHRWSSIYPFTTAGAYLAGPGVTTFASPAATYPNMAQAATIGQVHVFGAASSTTADRYIVTRSKVKLVDHDAIIFSSNRGLAGTWGDTPETGEDLVFEYSTDGSTWTTLLTITASSGSNGNTWINRFVSLPAGAQVAGGVFLRFRQAFSSGGTFDTWAITPPVILDYPADVTLNVNGSNLAGSPDYPTVVSGSVNISGAGSPYAIGFSSINSLPATIQVTWDGLTDQVTLGALYEPARPVTGLLTNEAHTISAAADGTVLGSFAAAGGTFRVFEGTTELTGNGEVGYYLSTYDSGQLTFAVDATTGVYTVSALAANTATVVLRAVYRGVVVEKTYTIAKAIAGGTGTRGSVTAYVGGQTAWSDAAANNYFTANYGGTKVLNDTVTQYGTNFSQTRFWNGAAWVQVTVAIDGNLLVSGTVGAAQLAVTTTLNVGQTFRVGTALVAGTTMTGAGAVLAGDGTAAIGNSTTNVTFNGSQITLNGKVVTAGNTKFGVLGNAILAPQETNGVFNIPTPGANNTPNTYATRVVSGGANAQFTVPSVTDPNKVFKIQVAFDTEFSADIGVPKNNAAFTGWCGVVIYRTDLSVAGVPSTLPAVPPSYPSPASGTVVVASTVFSGQLTEAGGWPYLLQQSVRASRIESTTDAATASYTPIVPGKTYAYSVWAYARCDVRTAGSAGMLSSDAAPGSTVLYFPTGQYFPSISVGWLILQTHPAIAAGTKVTSVNAATGAVGISVPTTAWMYSGTSLTFNVTLVGTQGNAAMAIASGELQAIGYFTQDITA